MLPARRRLPHHRPSWVDPHDLWFVTLCCQRPCTTPLTDPVTSQAIRVALAHAQEAGRLQLLLCTLMPDHLHMIARWSHSRGLAKEVAGLKRWWARQGVVWQRDFFDHRLRSDAEYESKAHYMRMNPVRAGLVARAEDWPHTWSGREVRYSGFSGDRVGRVLRTRRGGRLVGRVFQTRRPMDGSENRPYRGVDPIEIRNSLGERTDWKSVPT